MRVETLDPTRGAAAAYLTAHLLGSEIRKIRRPMVTAPATMDSPLVFLCHAGEQKRIFVDYINHALLAEEIAVFMDEDSLRLGDTASQEIFACLKTVPVGAATSSTLPQPQVSRLVAVTLLLYTEQYWRSSICFSTCSGGGAVSRVCAQALSYGGAAHTAGAQGEREGELPLAACPVWHYL